MSTFYEEIGGEETIRAIVHRFYEGVAEDPALRANRLALLRQLHDAMNRVADLARLAT